MKTINTKYVLKKMNGDDWLEVNTNTPVTFGYIMANVLSMRTTNPTLAWTLGKRISTEDIVDLKAEDIVFLKEEIQRNVANADGFLTTLGAGQLLEILDSSEDITRPRGTVVGSSTPPKL